MRDLGMNGPTTASRTITPTTATTTYYWGTTTVGIWYIDLGATSTSSRFTLHTWWPDTFAVFRLITTPLVSGDSFYPQLIHDADVSLAAATVEILRPLGLITIPAAGIPVGTEYRFTAPRQTQRYVALDLLTGAQWTSSIWEAFFEEGARAGVL
jgi:hypothetical protein